MKKYKEFNCLCNKIKIRYVEKISLEGNELGLYNPILNEILVCTHYNGQKIDKDVMDHTLYHEIAHAFFYHLGENELYHNEKLARITIQHWLERRCLRATVGHH